MSLRQTEGGHPTSRDRAMQADLLVEVSRTFALTIPQLPPVLRKAVGNGYLLCRIADTIEDDAGIDGELKFSLYEEFLNVLQTNAGEHDFGQRLDAALSRDVPSGERKLVRNLPSVLRTTHSLPGAQRQALIRCVRIMCNGMYEFQVQKSLDGLDTVADMNRYCYVVAGVVGEMLTDLFCDHSDAIRANRTTLMDLAVCFGQGLQMTNILKDIWEDRDAGSCWLPKSVFVETGVDLGAAIRNGQSDQLTAGIDELVSIANAHLHGALAYSCLIPKNYVSIRRFCLWAVGLALFTLQKIYRNPGYRNGQQVKISRRRVRAAVLSCNSVIYSNHLVRAWFDLASFGLPLAELEQVCDPETLRTSREGLAQLIEVGRDADVH